MIWQDWRLTLFLEWQPITWFLSVLWIVGLVNSFNMLDNMDGLSGGVAAIAASTLAAVLLLNPDPATQQPQMFVAGMLLVLVGGLLGFLWHNRPPARIFLGDAGSYFVGFCIASCTLLATFTSYRGPQPHAVLAPLCVLAVPIYDTVTVIWIRLRQGNSPFQADKNHFSHRLVELGFSRSQAVLTIYFDNPLLWIGRPVIAPRRYDRCSLDCVACGLRAGSGGAHRIHSASSIAAITLLLECDRACPLRTHWSLSAGCSIANLSRVVGCSQ